VQEQVVTYVVASVKRRQVYMRRLIFMLMRMMQKANMGSGDADRAYWENKGWLGKARPWHNSHKAEG